MKRVALFSTVMLAAAGLILATPASAAAPVLLRDPYLTDASGSWAMVNLATNTRTPVPVVSWGPASGNCAAPPNSVAATFVTAFGSGDQQFKARLTGLLPNTRYCYRVAQSGADLLGSAPVFTSALAAGDATPFSFAVISDWGAGTTSESNVLSRVAAAKPSLILTAGDNEQTSGSQDGYGDLRGGHVFAPQYWPKVGRTIPAFPAQGNHGFTTNLPYLQNWPQDGTAGACAATGCRYQQDTYCCTATLGSTNHTYASAWYAFDWGNSRFYVIEAAWGDSTGAYAGDFQGHFNGPVSGCPVCGKELTALTNDLSAHSAAHKFAVFHYPLYDDSSSQPSDTYLQGPNRLEGTLAKYGVNVVFNGHAHIYERNLPQIPGSPMVSYLTGGGGDALGSVSRHSAFDAFSQAIHEYLLVTVDGASVRVTPVNESGGTFDVQTYNFGGPPPPANEFSMSASPNSVSVTAGQSATSTISTTVTSGSPQPVSLSASGLPAGASASFNPASITSGGSSTLTLSTTAATPPGTSTVTVTGTGTSATHSATVRLDVSGSPPPNDFSISASPNSVSVTAGQGATSTISTTVTSGSPQPVSLSASGLPAGASASFNPASITSGGSSTLTLSTTAATPPGTSTVTVTGTGTSATHSTTVTLAVTGTGSGGPQLVQAAGARETASSTSLAATFAAPTGQGHLLVLSASVYTGATNTLRQVTDSGGNTWVKVGAYFSSGHYSDGELWYAANARPATKVTVSVATAAVVAIQVQEFSGMATSNVLDVATGASNTGTQASCGPVTAATANDLAVGFIAGHSVNQAITVTAAGFTALPQQTSTNGTATPASVVSAYRVLSGAPAQSFTGTFNSAMYWAAGMALFRAG